MGKGEITVRISGDAGPLKRAFGDAERETSGFMGKVGKVAGVAFAAVGAAAAAAAAKGVAAFADFDKGMREVFTLLPGATQQQMDAMTDQVKGFAKEFGVLPDEVVPALYQSLSAGVPPDNVFAYLETAQKAAKGGVTDLQTAVDGISSVVNAYGDDVVSAAEASDSMFTAVRLGKTNFQELSGSLYNVIPTASSLGVKFDDVTAAIATMTAQGTPTSVATTQMRQALVELSKEGGKASDTFETIAGKSFRDFVAEGGNVQDALQLMERHAADSGVGINDLFSSVEAGSAALSLTGKGTEAFGDALDAMAGKAGATEGAFETMDSGISATFDRLKAHASVALIDLGDRLAPVVEKVGEFALSVLPHLGEVAERVFGAMQRVAEEWGPVAVEAFRAVQAKVEEWWPVISSAFETVAGVISTVVETIAGLLGGFRGDLDTTEGRVSEWRDKLAEIWGKITEMFGAAFDALSTIVETGVGILRDFWNRFGDHLRDYAEDSFGRLLGIVSGAFDVLTGVFETVTGILTGDWSRAWDGIKLIVSGAWDVITGVVSQAWDTLTTIMGAGVAVISQAWGLAWGGIKDAFAGIWQGILGIARSAVNGVIGYVEDMVNGVIGGVNTALGALDKITPGGMARVGEVSFGRVGAAPALAPRPVGGRGGGVQKFHAGGMIGAETPGQVPGLNADERLIIGQVGERVIPRAGAGGGSSSLDGVEAALRELIQLLREMSGRPIELDGYRLTAGLMPHFLNAIHMDGIKV